jgi:DNA repair protein RadC
MKKIKELAEHDRPREKVRKKGVRALDDEELIQVILGRGVIGSDIRTISKKVADIIRKQKTSLVAADLEKVRGIGEAKAYQLLAAFEIARRHLMRDATKITCAKDVLPLLADIGTKQQEYFVCITLNGANEVIERRTVTVGLLDRSQVHPREVFADVITDRAAAVIFAHNHPSGDLRPSDADLKMQNQLTQAASILGLRVLDHMIVARGEYYSFQENGLTG